MTVFILVSGLFTGPHVWDDAVARLTAEGADARAVALSGLGGARTAAGAVVDLETHIADVLAVIDSVGRPGGGEIVLVGHDYGIHPVLGAADRRPGQVARIVYLDSAMPQDGVPASAALPDPRLRARLAGADGAGSGSDGAGSGAHGAGTDLPPPARGEWQLWGSTAGVPDAALDRLTALAAPHPLGTLVQPLRLTGAVASVPVTGVLCTDSGTTISMVQTQVDFGAPAMRALTAPGITFFELPTGHWPMLSAPAALTKVLLSAAAGEGHRLTAPDDARPPAHLRPFLLDVPGIDRERHAGFDLYVPPTAQGPLPAVLFVHGGPVPPQAHPAPRDWPALTGYARSVAGRGVVGVVVEHRLHAVSEYERAAADVAAAVERVRADPRVDADRIALWFFSGSGPISAAWLGAPPAWLRCLAANYPVMAPLLNWGQLDSRFRPVDAVARAGSLPVVLVRPGLETAAIAATVEEFMDAADRAGANLEVVDVPNGHHSFEGVDPTEESREAVRRALSIVLHHLTRGSRAAGAVQTDPHDAGR